MKKVYVANYDCGNDIQTEEFKANNLKEAKALAQAFKRRHLNDRRITTTVRLKDNKPTP